MTDTISFGLFLARLSPGSRLSFEQTRVNDEIWLPLHAQIRVDARLGLLMKVDAEVDVTYRDYRKFQTDSHMVAADKPTP